MLSKILNIGLLLFVTFLFIQCHNQTNAAQEAVSNVTETAAAAKEEALANTAQVKEAGAKALAEAKPTLTAAKEKVSETAASVADKAKEVATTAKEEVKEKAVEVKEKIVEAPKKKAKPKPRKRSKIAFEETIHQFGTIKQGDVVKHDFKFTNKGNAPLVIKSVEKSCGCTFPSYPFIPIEPGKEGTIGVTFDSKGKVGPQKPTITVVTNGRPRTLKLNLQGVVE